MKNKPAIFVFVVLGLLVLFLAIVFSTVSKKPDWNATYEKDDKDPYGDYILTERLPDLFPDQEIIICERSLYEELAYNSFIHDVVDKEEGTYFFVTDRFQISDNDWDELVNYVGVGGNVFIASHSFNPKMNDFLGIGMSHSFYEKDFSAQDFQGVDSEISLNFINPKLKREGNYFFREKTVGYYFAELDSINTTILAVNSLNQATYVKVGYGSGYFYLNTTPLAFTNYNMLYHGNDEFISKSLSYFPADKPIYWDEYYKPMKYHGKTEGELAFIMKYEGLKWAWYLILTTAFIYVLFNMKRVQRIIPVLTAPKNSTLEFVRTVSQLYYRRGEHSDIAQKKVHFFYNYIRTSYYLNPMDQDDAFFKKLSMKASMEEPELRKLFNYLSFVSGRSTFSEQELHLLNKKINDFKNGRKS
ncbi:MAG: DUF4350 domain-containing protein [Cytophagales bacterium]|nr:DUF4350 domain-containing protein [Cytophagales bacterium]